MMPPPDRTRAPGERLFTWLLRAYPPTFRARYRDDLIETFRRDRVRPQFSGATGRLAFWRHTLSDLARTAWSERRLARPRDVEGLASGLALDLRQSTRALARHPGFSLVAVLTLGLGIGATTTIFAIVNGVLLTPLPYPEPDRLVRVYERERDTPGAQMVAYGNYADLAGQADAFEHLAIFTWGSRVLTGVSEALQIRTRETSANFATTMGVSPALGRWFSEDEARAGTAVVVITHDLWTSALAGQPDVLGTTLLLDGAPFEIVGVMPPGFDFPSQSRAWVPLEPVTDPVGQRQWHRHNMVGRLAPGISVAVANERMDTIAARLEAAYPDYNRGNYFAAVALLDDVVADRRASLIVLSLAVGALLVIACVNIASLTLARSVSRTRELALRTAIGASGWRLARLVTMEMTILAAAGGLVGLLLSGLGVRALLSIGEASIPRAESVAAINGRVFAFALLMSFACGLAVSLLPMLRGRRLTTTETAAALRGTRGSASRSVVRGRRVLVTAQLTIAFVLAIGAGLLVRSFDRLQSVPTGVSTDGVLTLNVRLPSAKYPTPADTARFLDALVTDLEAVPGVERAGATLTPPVSDNGWYNGLTIRGRAVPTADVPPISYVVATAGYLEALDVPLVAGRFFEPGEPRGERVAIINQAAAEQHWPGEDPVGQRILGRADDESTWARVVGVVGDVRQSLVRDAVPEVYVPVAQDRVLSFVVVVKSAVADPASVVEPVRQAIAAADPDTPITSIMPLDDRIGLNIAEQKFRAALVAALAGLAVLLAAAGVFGVVSYTVAERRREFGIRLAMGATGTRVIATVLREGVVLAAVAIAIGVAIAAGISRLIEGLLFEIGAGDPVVYATVGAVVLVVSVIAGLGPSLRATAADPLVVLREE